MENLEFPDNFPSGKYVLVISDITLSTNVMLGKVEIELNIVGEGESLDDKKKPGGVPAKKK